MSIRLLALDIDGTLTANSQNEISPRCKEAILAARDAGAFVTIATGRAIFATRPIWDAMELTGPSIQYGGAQIVDAPDGSIVDQRPLAPELVRDIMQYMYDQKIPAQIYFNDEVIVEKENDYTKRYVEKNGMRTRVDPDLRARTFDSVPKILAFSENEEALRAALMQRYAGRAHVTYSQPTFIEVNDTRATKGHALARLAQRLHIDRSEVAAMGDSYLDADMIEWAGTGVCMSDSVQDIIQIADVVAPDQRHDGVAWFIEHYILR